MAVLQTIMDFILNGKECQFGIFQAILQCMDKDLLSILYIILYFDF